MEYRILGPLEVLDESGRKLSLGGARQQSVLASLLLRLERTVALERLIDELWDNPPPTAARTLQVYVSRLRHTLPENAIDYRPGGYALRLVGNSFDLKVFEQTAEEGRAAFSGGECELAAQLFTRALALWRGPALAGLNSEAMRREAERLEGLRLQVLEDRLEADIASGHHREVVPELEALVAEQPFRERFRAQLMLALYRSGRQTEALDVYEQTRRILHDDLGLDPSPSLQELQQAILRQDASITAEAPTPASLGGTNLPVQPTPFMGRERELAEVLALLRDSDVRLLTLTGAGGSGKTRLALQVAAEAIGFCGDGVFWVPLQALRDPDLVEPSIAQAVGARDDLVHYLASMRILLLLDNFEHLISAADKLGDLCAQLPNLKLLITSREPLHLAAEHEYPVAPLREPEAVDFFSERARAVKPDFREDEVVPEICLRLDCLPLALELAAARVKALSTEDLLQRLDKRLPLLTGGPRDAPERQRTLRATIGWSYELLAPDEQRLFAGLAIFVGGCTLEAAEDVCRAEVEAVAALVDKSLLRREGQRYFMLETIGEYALERLVEGGELDELRRRHAEYYLELARSVEELIRSPKAAALLDRLERDHDNLRAALAWLSGAPPDRALQLAVWGLAGRLHSFADLALDRGNAIEAARLYRESLEIGHRLGDDLQTAYCLAGLAAVGANRGKREIAARIWGCVRTFEERSGGRLHEEERVKYERALHGTDEASDTAPDFIQGKLMTLDEAVEYALANID
jgi:predicted ATPase/DNA-binding SARP family transcriptional activator